MFITFQYPEFLWLLLLIPIFILIFLIGNSYNKKKAVKFANFEAIERIRGANILSRGMVFLYLNIIVLCLFIFSMSGMEFNYYADTSSYSFIIAIDSSNSMGAEDLLPNRLEAAKSAAKNFVNNLPVGVRVGVISFSGRADIMQGLETEKIKTNIAIDKITFGEIEGTSIYNALQVSDDLLTLEKRKAVIVISDGQANIGSTPQIIEYANDKNIIIHTIAIGTEQGGVTPYNTLSKADLDSLKSMAFNTDGKFFHIQEKADFVQSFDSILERVGRETTVDFSLWLALGALAFLTLAWIVYSFRFKGLP